MNEIIAKYSKMLIDLTYGEKIRFHPSMGDVLPRKGGVYRISKFENDKETSLFVGSSSDLRRRIHNNHNIGTKNVSIFRTKLLRQESIRSELEVLRYLHTSCSVQYILIPDHREMKMFEHFAIAVLQPIFND
jgi:excinuclease UvrABC nuclease subunit